MNSLYPSTIRIVPPLRTSRFFTVPTLGEATDQQSFGSYLIHDKGNLRSEEGLTIMRYAAYVRVSHEEQVNGYSLDAQRRAIAEWVAGKGGALVKVYSEEGESATTTNRTEFQKMRLDARNGKFDTLIVHKLDRFARNRTDSLAIKSLLRYDYKIKVFSVSEPTEDSDGPIGALIEGIMECVADWYSRNLAAEVAKGKRERGQQGLHNNRVPFGYDKDENKVLVLNQTESSGLIMAFEHYSTGKYSDGDIADLLNQHGYKTKNQRPFSKETVREMLQNRTYIGKVRYQQYKKGTIRKNRANIPDECWFDGQHEGLISEDLFERCLKSRRQRAVHLQSTPKYNPYLLRGLVFCYRCCANHDNEYSFPAYGKMRAHTKAGQLRTYRCRAKDFGRSCEQRSVHCDTIEDQVIEALMTLKPPQDWHKHITEAMSAILGKENLEERLAEIKAAIDRMDFRWDQGFITDKMDYLEKRVKLQQELEALTPIPEDDLERAADMLENFGKHWKACNGDIEEQHRLVSLIVDRVYVQDDRIAALTLKADYHIVLGTKPNEPTVFTIGSYGYTHGDDGYQPPFGIRLIPPYAKSENNPKPVIKDGLSKAIESMQYKGRPYKLFDTEYDELSVQTLYSIASPLTEQDSESSLMLKN